MERYKLLGKLGVTLLTLVALPAFAEAGFLSSFIGSTQMSDNGNSDGVVNFAVYANDGTSSGDWRVQLGLGGDVGGKAQFIGVSDKTAAFVFFYQVVNTNPSGGADPALVQLKVANNGVPYSSTGFLASSATLAVSEGEVFQDVDGLVGPQGNEFIGSNGPFADDPIDGVPTQTAALASPFNATLAGAIRPTTGTVDDLAGFAGFSFATLPLSSGGFSTILFLTSNMGPVGYGVGNLRDGDPTSNGDIPVHAPAPMSAVLFGIGCLGLVYWKRKNS